MELKSVRTAVAMTSDFTTRHSHKEGSMFRFIGTPLVLLLMCGGVFVAFLFVSLIAVLFVRRHTLSWKGKFLYYWTLMLELPGVAARFVVFLVLAPALLT